MAEINREINAVLSARRKKAYDDMENIKAEIYKKIPDLLKIDEEITLSGIRFAQEHIRNAYDEMRPDELSRHIIILRNEKENLLKIHGYTADYLEPRYICPICRDTGTIRDPDSFETKSCNCYRQLYLDSLYQVSNILGNDETGFEFFKDSYYSDIPDKKRYDSDISPKDQIIGIRNHCLDFVEGFGNLLTPNLYFFGSAGTGKTFMAKSVGLEIIKRGYTVLYLSAPTLFEIIRKARYFSEGDERNADSSYRNLIYTELLILDDLGTEPASDARYAEFLTLLEARKARSMQQASKMIISSNLRIKLLYQLYNERIVSRIAGEFGALRFFGDDIRILKKYT